MLVELVLLFLCGAVILYAGPRISRHADTIADQTGIARTWIGLVLLAAVTSLPELLTGASAVLLGAPDLAVGDVLGSAMFNMLIVAGLIVAGARLPEVLVSHRSDVVAGLFGVVMLAIAAAAIFAGDRVPAVGWIGLPSLAFLVLFFVALRATSPPTAPTTPPRTHRLGRVAPRTLGLFAWNALAVVVAASALPHFADVVATRTGLGRTFVGTTAVAIMTSLPEVVVSVAAFRIGAVPLALGNLFGSNLFDMLVLAVDDVLHRPGPILAAVHEAHVVSAVAAAAMTLLVLAGLRPGASSSQRRFAWTATFVVYAAATVAGFRLR